MRPNVKLVVRTFVAILLLIIYCEYLIYFIVQKQCHFPELNPKNRDKSIEYNNESPVRIMVLADTHLLGSRGGHWFDKLRREWQMYRAFQTAMSLHQPEMVFILGDLTDEGLYCGKDEFDYYIKRFHSLFKVPQGTELHVTVGNHDIGFHYGITPYLNNRFVTGFKTPSVQMISKRGNHFVLINSMALEGDGCFLCRPAEIQLTKIERKLKCSKGIFNNKCQGVRLLDKFSKPILMQHFPLYRQSDMDCKESDSAPMSIKVERFRERLECISQEATDQILGQLRPRIALSGHTHHGCVLPLPSGDGVEITVPSFSWRNKNNPTYSLFTITPDNWSVYKCDMPKETSVYNAYILGGACIVFSIIYSIINRSRRKVCKLN